MCHFLRKLPFPKIEFLVGKQYFELNGYVKLTFNLLMVTIFIDLRFQKVN